MAGAATVGSPADRQWPLAGRDREIAAALHALDAGARLVSIHGPTGVGKSRLLAEIAGRLAATGRHTVQLGGSAILSVVPLGALSAQFPGLSPYDGTSPDPARLFAEASSALAGSSEGRPTVLLVDDATLLDGASMLLVAQLAAAGRVSLVVTLRPGDPLPETLVATWNAARDLRLDLEALDAEAARSLIEAALGGVVAHRTVTTLHSASGGNPLYLRELVLGARAAGSLADSTGVWQLAGAASATPTLRELVLARIGQLDATARDVLERLAVCGELRPDQLAGDPTAVVRPALAALETAGLVEVTASGASIAEPVHATVLTESMSRLRVEDILGEQAALLAAKAGGSPDLLQVTLWQLEAGLPVDADVILTATRLAAGTGDHASILRLAGAGLRAHPDHAELLLLLADAQLRTGQVDAALATLARHPSGANLAGRGGARTARLIAVAQLTGRGPLAALAVLDESLGNGPAHPALELTRAAALVAAGRPTDAERVAREAAPLLGDGEEARIRVLHARSIALACMGREDDALAAAAEAVAFAEATDGTVLGLCRAETQLAQATVLHLAGRYGQARTTAVRALAEAADTGDEILGRSIEFLLGRIALDAGHLASAERWLAETISGATSVGPPGLAGLARLSLTAAQGASGALELARATLAAVPEDLVPASWYALARAWADRGGDIDTTLRHSAEAAASALAGGNVALAATAWQVAIELDRPDAAAEPLRAMASSTGSRLVALLADHATAAAAGDHARLLEIADAWEERDGLRLAAAAAATAARALGSSRTAASARARAEDLVRRCDGLDTPVVRQPDGVSPLTPREREIATLAAAGSTSKQIAAQLFLSSRTVDNHLQSVYTKLGITGRQALAEAFRR
jgi:DNA-binding CsgD family transcriptional regulator